MIALLLCTSPTLLWAELPKQPAPVVEVDNVVQTAATSLSFPDAVEADEEPPALETAPFTTTLRPPARSLMPRVRRRW